MFKQPHLFYVLVVQLIEIAKKWNKHYVSKLHSMAKESLESVTEMIRQRSKGLQRPVTDIDALRHVMDTLKSITQQESGKQGKAFQFIRNCLATKRQRR